MKKRLTAIFAALCLMLALCPVPALAAEGTHLFHTPQLTGTKAATETEPGYTGDVVCESCGEVLMEGIEIPATGSEQPEQTEPTEPTETTHRHSPVLTGQKEATDTEPGYTGDITCESCGEVLLEGTEIAATGTDTITRENPFVDVGTLAYYYEPVLWAYYGGVTTGTTATTFSPHDDCTRAQVVTFLWRAMGQPEPELEECAFADIDTGAYYYKAVLWAVETGVTTGTAATTFDPERTCTRGEVVTFLWRSQGQPGPESADASFSDVAEGLYYSDAVLWAIQEGITNGYGDGTFRPERTCNRAEIVTFLYRCFA